MKPHHLGVKFSRYMFVKQNLNSLIDVIDEILILFSLNSLILFKITIPMNYQTILVWNKSKSFIETKSKNPMLASNLKKEGKKKLINKIK